MSDGVSMTLEEAYATAFEVLCVQGCSEPQAEAIAETITAAERDRCASHGLFRIPFYVRAIRGGIVRPQAVPTFTDLAPGVLKIDGGLGFAPLALKLGAEPIAERARTQGIAALALTNVCHIAALWPEVERLVEWGLVAFAFTGASSFVAPAGGTRPLYGTNPMAFGWPRAGHPPMVFDQASSASARGEIQLHLRDGKPIPEGWAIGPDGEPTTDAARALEGAQLPFGGHKGAAIALMVELLAGALIGSVFSFEAQALDTNNSGVPPGGEFMIVIDPSRCIAGEDAGAQLQHAEALFERILAQEGTRLPSQRRFAARAETVRDGIWIPAALATEIDALRTAV